MDGTEGTTPLFSKRSLAVDTILFLRMIQSDERAVMIGPPRNDGHCKERNIELSKPIISILANVIGRKTVKRLCGGRRALPLQPVVLCGERSSQEIEYDTNVKVRVTLLKNRDTI